MTGPLFTVCDTGLSGVVMCVVRSGSVEGIACSTDSKRRGLGSREGGKKSWYNRHSDASVIQQILPLSYELTTFAINGFQNVPFQCVPERGSGPFGIADSLETIEDDAVITSSLSLKPGCNGTQIPFTSLDVFLQLNLSLSAIGECKNTSYLIVWLS